MPPDADESPPLPELRLHYEKGSLRRADLADCPFVQFRHWLDDAVKAGIPDPNAMTVATVDADGIPSARTLLLKGLEDGEFCFYTNTESRKGRDLAARPVAALVFLWRERERQVCVRGPVRRLEASVVETYFRERPYDSQIGAWASMQSEVIPDRRWLEARLAEFRARFPEDRPVPVPPSWGGYGLQPLVVEFWQGRPGRLHDRFVYERSEITERTWEISRLSP